MGVAIIGFTAKYRKIRNAFHKNDEKSDEKL